MRERDEKVRALVAPFKGAGRDPHYAAYFACFNRGNYFEAHEVLEVIWLGNQGQEALFYKGLIQLAGAFVHVQKHRHAPAMALLRLARTNLARYAPVYRQLDVAFVLELIEAWASRLEHALDRGTGLETSCPPHLSLLDDA